MSKCTEHNDCPGHEVQPISDESTPFDRLAIAVGEAAEREGFFGIVLVSFTRKPDSEAWGMETCIGVVNEADAHHRPEMVRAAAKALMPLPSRVAVLPDPEDKP